MASSNLTPSATLEATPSVTLLPGARLTQGGVNYCVWAPEQEKVSVVIGESGTRERTVSLERALDGYFSGRDPSGVAGDCYRFLLDEKTLLPDVVSRYQPFGVFGPSMVIDPALYAWKAQQWKRPALQGRVIYELHIGTFSEEGTFLGAIPRLDYLVDLGVNTIELMPVADFPGRWNWGYDGVMLYAPARCYGHPDDLRALVDGAHLRGLAVVLDVVYNHLGPAGNHLPAYTHYYFHPERMTPWGKALNIEGHGSGPVRSFFIQNALYWMDEFRFDGLRLDSTHSVKDSSDRHLFSEVSAAVHSCGGFTIAEDERNESAVLTPSEEGGWGVDAVWADDFHHSVRVALTGQRQGLFSGFNGTPDEWVETLTHGWFYRGQFFSHWKRNRGSPGAHFSPERLVYCISNHDQVGNRPLGERLHHSVTSEIYRAVSVMLCLCPYTPMLFMGQEWAASTPFKFFTDLPPEIGQHMDKYRIAEFRKYGFPVDDEIIRKMGHPQDEQTFRSSKLEWSEVSKSPHELCWHLYRECLQLRKREAIFQNRAKDSWQVKKIGTSIVGIRWRKSDGDWLLLVTLLQPSLINWNEDEFVSPKAGMRWQPILYSNESRFGGTCVTPMIFGDINSIELVGAGSWLMREAATE